MTGDHTLWLLERIQAKQSSKREISRGQAGTPVWPTGLAVVGRCLDFSHPLVCCHPVHPSAILLHGVLRPRPQVNGGGCDSFGAKGGSWRPGDRRQRWQVWKQQLPSRL